MKSPLSLLLASVGSLIFLVVLRVLDCQSLGSVLLLSSGHFLCYAFVVVVLGPKPDLLILDVV